MGDFSILRLYQKLLASPGLFFSSPVQNDSEPQKHSGILSPAWAVFVLMDQGERHRELAAFSLTPWSLDFPGKKVVSSQLRSSLRTEEALSLPHVASAPLVSMQKPWDGLKHFRNKEACLHAPMLPGLFCYINMHIAECTFSGWTGHEGGLHF